MNACGIILAAGHAHRMGCDANKVFLKFEDESAIVRSLKTFSRTGLFTSFVIACRPDEQDIVARKATTYVPEARCIVCAGGDERQYSVERALRHVPPDTDYIAVHDAARCFVTTDVIEDCMRAAVENGSGVAAIHATDTIKRVSGAVIEETLERSALVCVQTPQIFTADVLRDAYKKAREDGFLGTDDASLVERLGTPVYIAAGSPENIKLTCPRDIGEGERILEKRRACDDMRVGTGFDMHAFAPNRPLILGGVHIPEAKGLDGHSDADVLTHAIMDALLGAAGCQDIGQLFPDDDPEYEGACSVELLATVGTRIRELGYSISNVDSTLLLERPKVAGFIGQMRDSLARALNIQRDCVNVKATTCEKLGVIGREEGAAAQAVCLLKRSSLHA